MLTLEERNLLAEFMGWKAVIIKTMEMPDIKNAWEESIGPHNKIYHWMDHYLTDPESPSGLFQIFGKGGLVKKAREKGWFLNFFLAASNTKMWKDGLPIEHKCYASFYCYPKGDYHGTGTMESETIGLTVCKAILEVIKAQAKTLGLEE